MRRSRQFDFTDAGLKNQQSPNTYASKIKYHAVKLLKQLNNINHDHAGRKYERRVVAQSLDGLINFKKSFH